MGDKKISPLVRDIWEDRVRAKMRMVFCYRQSKGLRLWVAIPNIIVFGGGASAAATFTFNWLGPEGAGILALVAAVTSVVAAFMGWHHELVRYTHASDLAVAQENRWSDLFRRSKADQDDATGNIATEARLLREIDAQIESLMPRHEPMDDESVQIEREVLESLGAK
jgi:hypothetical protein